MAIPANVMRLTLQGHGTGADIWSNSYWWACAPGSSVPSNNAQAATTLAAMLSNAKATTFRTWLLGIMPAVCTIDQATLYCYPTGGPSSPAIAEAPWFAVGTNGVGPMPPQTCMVASLRTGQSGRSFRGRVYLPKQSAVLSGGHQFSAADTTSAANAVAAFLSGWEADAILPDGTGIFAVVVSVKRGVASAITSVVVDSKPDVQRRRINKMTTENVNTHAVT